MLKFLEREKNKSKDKKYCVYVGVNGIQDVHLMVHLKK